jgi:catechol 2,3-dioxygenase
MTSHQTVRPIDLQVRIGHLHLKVADLERALASYCGVLGFELTQRYGTQAAFDSRGNRIDYDPQPDPAVCRDCGDC